MHDLSFIWLPILLSSVAVFLVSSILHMFTPWHKGDFAQVPDEARVMDALRPFNIPPGDYMVPRPGSMDDMRSQAHLDKLNRGPVWIMTVFPNGMTGIGRNLGLWFAYVVLVNGFAACVAGSALPSDAGNHAHFHYVGIIAFSAYSLALIPLSIWFRRGWGATIRGVIDGLIFGVVTGAIFAWMWPH